MKQLLLTFTFALLSWNAVNAQVFRVQAAAFADSIERSYFKDRGVEGVLVMVDPNGIYRYLVGSFNTLDEAEAMRQQLVAKGFPNAAVIDMEVQRALYEVPCTYFTGNPTVDPTLGPNVRNIYFESGSAEIDADGRRELDRIAQTLKENPNFKLRINCHTDAKGSAESNQQLATARGRITRDYLIQRGVNAERMFITIYGEAKPAVDNQDFYGNDLPSNRKWNRRITLAIIDESGEIGKE